MLSGGNGVLILKTMDDAQVGMLYETCMRRDFPPSELKSLSSILRMKRRDEYDVFGAYQPDGALAAYALLYHPAGERVALLDYLAVEPDCRRTGVGSMLLGMLRTYYAASADVLLIECERPKAAPNEAQARERIHFYTQAGAQLTSVRICLFDVEYSILVLPCGERIPARDWAEQMLALYRQMLPKALFEQNVRLIRA